MGQADAQKTNLSIDDHHEVPRVDMTKLTSVPLMPDKAGVAGNSVENKGSTHVDSMFALNPLDARRGGATAI